MAQEERLRKEIELLRVEYYLSREKLSRLQRSRVIETDPAVVFKLEYEVRSAQVRREQIEKELEELEEQLEKSTLQASQRPEQKSWKVFISSAPQDDLYRQELRKHLKLLEKSTSLHIRDSSDILGGSSWKDTIQTYINEADIIVILVSSDFIASDLFNTISNLLPSLKETVRILPILVRSSSWEYTALADLQVLPRNNRPLNQQPDRDEAWAEIARNIGRVYEDLLSNYTLHLQEPSSLPERVIVAQPVYKFHKVFVKSNFPHITFVEHNKFQQLVYAIDTPGRGVVIEGPSGIGKTTSIKQAMEILGLNTMYYLSARNQKDLQRIQTLEDWHEGIAIIDDFHRLDEPTRQYIVDYLKYLADTEPEDKKVVIIGIPHTHQKLVSLSFDLATRIDVFNFSRVDDEIIQRMIEKGEAALNISFDRKSEIVSWANGSLNVAQYLCWHLCIQSNIKKTVQTTQLVRCNVEAAVTEAIQEFSIKFGDILRAFAKLGGKHNVLTLQLLEKLASCEDGYLSLHPLKNQWSNLANSIDRFINEHWIEKLYQKLPESRKLLFFDTLGTALVIDDPQLMFYLNYFARTHMSQLSREVGKKAALAPRKVFISYSHQDTLWLKRLQVHLRPLEHEGKIELWSDKKITGGAIWQDEIRQALGTARMAVALVSADFLASSFIRDHELPTLLEQAQSGGTTIKVVIVSPCLFSKSKLNIFQTSNPPNQPLTALDYNAQEQILTDLAEEMSNQLEEESDQSEEDDE